jgi:hypothetical protein
MYFRQFGIALLVAMLPALSAGAADERCLAAAGSELERLYCEVMARGAGASLPSQPDFNRNSPRVQALLLKRPAQQLGLTLPQPAPLQTPEPPDEPEPEPFPGTEPASGPVGALADCRLSGEEIRCPAGDYELVTNRPRSELAEGALGPDNRLEFESFAGSRDDEDAVRSYLSRAYDQYIPKMLRIGLGANTMSFTAFHNAFHTLESGGVDFSERMARTYELLKQDRQQLGVKTRYHDKLPESLSWCGYINRNIVVCDNVGTNWVYVRANR